MTERSRRVVLLIDYDNLQICAARDTPGRDLQLTPVVQLAQRYGTVILARAYAEWNLSTERLAVYKAGIEPAFAPVLRTESDRSGKSLADTVMVAEGMDMLWTLSPEVVVLATSDKDLIPLVRVAKQRGAFVVVLGSDFTAIPLREMADEHVTYRQLISDAGVRYATEAGPGRQPAALPEPTRRRRERNGRERGTPPPATAGPSAGTPAPSQPRTEPPAQPAAAPAQAQPAASPGAEPVAPVTSTAQGEADAQSSGRRRRRRGGRRRSDRLGLTSEGLLSGEEADGAEEGDGVEEAEEAEAVSEVEVEAAAEAEVEVEAEAVEELTPTLTVADEALVSEAPVEEASAVTVAPAEEEAPPVRRRRTRRRVAEPAEESTSAMFDAEQVTPEVVPPQSADIQPAPPPEAATSNGTPSEADGEVSPEATDGASAEEEPAATPTRRPRRVASASRGRSRRA